MAYLSKSIRIRQSHYLFQPCYFALLILSLSFAQRPITSHTTRCGIAHQTPARPFPRQYGSELTTQIIFRAPHKPRICSRVSLNKMKSLIYSIPIVSSCCRQAFVLSSIAPITTQQPTTFVFRPYCTGILTTNFTADAGIYRSTPPNSTRSLLLWPPTASSKSLACLGSACCPISAVPVLPTTLRPPSQTA